MLRIQMVPSSLPRVEAARTMTGYVLTVENITRSIEEEAQRDRALHPEPGQPFAIGNIRAAVANLIDYPDMEPDCASASCAYR